MNQLYVDIDGITYADKICGMNIGYEQIVLDATVFVDGSDLVNHFNVTCNGKWIGIQRVRNKLTIVVNKNNSLNGRGCSINFTHNLDPNVSVGIDVWQNPCEYTISVDQDHLIFDNLLEYSDPEKTETVINVTTLNGVRDFGVGPVAEYVRTFEYTQYRVGEKIFEDDTYYIKNGDNYDRGDSISVFPYTVGENDEFYYYEVKDLYREGETIFEGQKYWYKNENVFNMMTATEKIEVPENDGVYYRVSNDFAVAYDHGLKLTKTDNTTLTITNYGKICLYDDFYYILTLYNKNNPRCIAQIRIDYADSCVNNETGFNLDGD